MEDGEGVLGDGTRYLRQSGEEKGRNGYWHRWTRLQGVSAGGKVNKKFSKKVGFVSLFLSTI